MELTGGDKHGETGVIPQDWTTAALGALTDPRRPISYGIVQTGPRVLKGVRCLRVVDVEDGRINKTGHITTSKAISAAYSRTILQSADLVMPLRGKVGDVALVDQEIAGSNLTRGLALIAARPGLSPSFLRQTLSSAATRSRLETSMNGSALQEIPIATLRAFHVALPPTEAEQEAIAEALSDADDFIDSLVQLLAKKRHVRQGAMQELLTCKRRLPGFVRPWVTRRLGEIASVKTGTRNNQEKTDDGRYPFFVRSATVERIDTYSHDCEAILIPGEGGIGSIFHYINGRFDVHQRVYAITQFSADWSPRFIYSYMAAHFGAHAMANSVKATVDSLRLPTFLEFRMTLPPTVEEQVAIATVLTDMESEINALDTKLSKARQIKQGMMQELLTGRIRLV